MQATINGIRLHYRIDGDVDAPWLVLANSLATNLSLWDGLVARLSPRFRILRYDQRGHGATEAPRDPYPIDTLIDDAIGLVDHVGITTANFCGISLGGATVMGLAQRHPSRVTRLAVCATPCVSTPASAAQWRERVDVVRQSGMAGIVDATLARWFTAETLAADPPHVGAVRQMILDTSVDGFAGCAAALSDHDFRTSLDALRGPTLFIVGERDAPRDAMRDMHDALPTSRLVELPDAGHLCNLDRPDEFAAACQAFFATAG